MPIKRHQTDTLPDKQNLHEHINQNKQKTATKYIHSQICKLNRIKWR